MSRSWRPAALALTLLLPLPAAAQMPPTGMGPGGEDEPTPEGVAEKAPSDPGHLPSVPVIPPWPGKERKKYQLVEIEGYYRLRTAWRSTYNLGFANVDNGVPYPQSLSCQAGSTTTSSCTDSIGTADMRLRLEPTFHLSEQVSLHLQADLLDNLVLGATPEGVFGAAGGSDFASGQVSPQAGANYAIDSIRVKRAWGEVVVPDLGVFRFGRMPDQFGLGILHNGGGKDPLHDTTCYDCELGSSVDRISFGRQIPGTPLDAAAGMTWASTGANSDTTGTTTEGHGVDLEDADDITEWLVAITRLDRPGDWKKRVDAGGLALNYGLNFTYRSQELDAAQTLGAAADPASLVKRGLDLYSPDGYVRLGWGKLTVEGEVALQFGSIGNWADVVGSSAPFADLTIFTLGAVARASYKLLDDDLTLGFETGFASGDQWENAASGNTNINGIPRALYDANDTTISAFRFSPDYHIDMILFRDLIGAVSNTTYIRPSFTYRLSRRFLVGAQGVVSFANIPVSTPGNGLLYGVEFDADLGYANAEEGVFAGISGGVLFPLDAMSHPADIFGTTSDVSGETATTIQMRVVLDL